MGPQKNGRGFKCSHLVDALVQPGTRKVERLLGSDVPVAPKVQAVDEYSPLLPALEAEQGTYESITGASNVKPHRKADRHRLCVLPLHPQDRRERRSDSHESQVGSCLSPNRSTSQPGYPSSGWLREPGP